MMTKKENVLLAFVRGEQLSAKQMKSRFGIGNPTALVSSLRFEGYPIYLNEGRGDKVSKYRLGTATRAVVAAGYRALSGQAA